MPRSWSGSARVRTVRRLYILARLQVSQYGFFGMWQSLCFNDMGSLNNSSSLPTYSSSDSTAASGAAIGASPRGGASGGFCSDPTASSGLAAEEDDAGNAKALVGSCMISLKTGTPSSSLSATRAFPLHRMLMSFKLFTKYGS